MTSLPSAGIPITTAAPEVTGASPDHWMAELGVLLRELDAVAGHHVPVVGGQSLPLTPEESHRRPVGQTAAGHRRQPVCRLAMQACGHGEPFDPRGADLFGLGHAAGFRRTPARATGNRRLAARHRHRRHARPRSAEAGAAGQRRSGDHGPGAGDEPGDPPPQLHLDRDSGHRGKHCRLVRRQPRQFRRVLASRFPWPRG